MLPVVNRSNIRTSVPPGKASPAAVLSPPFGDGGISVRGGSRSERIEASGRIPFAADDEGMRGRGRAGSGRSDTPGRFPFAADDWGTGRLGSWGWTGGGIFAAGGTMPVGHSPRGQPNPSGRSPSPPSNQRTWRLPRTLEAAPANAAPPRSRFPPSAVPVPASTPRPTPARGSPPARAPSGPRPRPRGSARPPARRSARRPRRASTGSRSGRRAARAWPRWS